MYTFLFTAAAEGKGKSGEDFFQKVSCFVLLPLSDNSGEVSVSQWLHSRPMKAPLPYEGK